jgi:hypothetical protein
LAGFFLPRTIKPSVTFLLHINVIFHRDITTLVDIAIAPPIGLLGKNSSPAARQRHRKAGTYKVGKHLIRRYAVRVWREGMMVAGYAAAIAKETFYGVDGDKVGTTLGAITAATLGTALLLVSPVAAVASIAHPVGWGALGIAVQRMAEPFGNSVIPAIKKRFRMRRFAAQMSETNLAASDPEEVEHLRRNGKSFRHLALSRENARFFWERKRNLHAHLERRRNPPPRQAPALLPE